ncbi:hypothetical protein HK100_005531 [Physocladia obscura]|uniref:Uncharacterized protein n=1 Tax=Physocladia obscura TaxID=109957 RepID=A0AAD5X818_9FUNG|nr:hypothetical protein HK100_005531 [Physocladia obscura]
MFRFSAAASRDQSRLQVRIALLQRNRFSIVLTRKSSSSIPPTQPSDSAKLLMELEKARPKRKSSLAGASFTLEALLSPTLYSANTIPSATPLSANNNSNSPPLPTNSQQLPQILMTVNDSDAKKTTANGQVSFQSLIFKLNTQEEPKVQNISNANRRGRGTKASTQHFPTDNTEPPNNPEIRLIKIFQQQGVNRKRGGGIETKPHFNIEPIVSETKQSSAPLLSIVKPVFSKTIKTDGFDKPKRNDRTITAPTSRDSIDYVSHSKPLRLSSAPHLSKKSNTVVSKQDLNASNKKAEDADELYFAGSIEVDDDFEDDRSNSERVKKKEKTHVKDGKGKKVPLKDREEVDENFDPEERKRARERKIKPKDVLLPDGISVVNLGSLLGLSFGEF